MEFSSEPKWKAARRRRIIDTGFEMFSNRGIDLVSVDEIAGACGMTRATIYRYYPSKLDLVIEIGAVKWKECIAEISKRYPDGSTDSLTAREHFALLIDCFMDLYREKRGLLRFNQYFNLYVKSAGATNEQMGSYLGAVGILRGAFGRMYGKALRDGTVRTDLSEESMFSAFMHIMLAAITRYAVGLAYVSENGADPEDELKMLKKMFINYFSNNKEESK